MDLGVINGRDMVAVPDPTRGGRDQAGQGPGNAVLVPAAVLGEGFQGLPVGGLLQGQHRLGDGVFLDVDGHGGDPLGEAVEPAAGEGPSEGIEQACQRDQVSLASVIMRLLCWIQQPPTWQVPTRRRYFSIRYVGSVIVRFFVETTV